MADKNVLNALGEKAAYQLADVAKTTAQYQAISPRC